MLFIRTFWLGVIAVLIVGCGADTAPGISTGGPHGNDHANMDHSAMGHGPMDHSNMRSSPNAAAADLDLQFIDTMIVHHQGAVDMARLVFQKAESPQLRSLATSIVTGQESEIAEMKRWRDSWFAGQPPAINMELPGMADSMKGMDMAKLGTLQGKAFDIEFATQMIPHHEGALVMTREAIKTTKRDEIRRLSNEIIGAQQAEIELMQGWIKEWSK